MTSHIKVLVADDDRLTRRVLTHHLEVWGYVPIEADGGSAAMQVLEGDDPPALALVDWMMPGIDGLEVCRRVRAGKFMPPPHLILVTARERPEDVVKGLDAGANDYIVKPVNSEELRARIAVGARMIGLERELVARVRELEAAQAEIRKLREVLPICAVCKKIRDDDGAYHQLEAYISQHANVLFSHGYCPECGERALRDIDAWTPEPK